MAFQFICEADIQSQAIAWFGAGPFSHVDAILEDGRLLGARSDKVGGRPAGVQIRPPNYAKFSRRMVMTNSVTNLQADVFYRFLFAQVGKPYDYEAIWAFAFARNWRETDSWICSELQAAAAEAASIVPKLYMAANKITPVTAAMIFSAIGGAGIDQS